MAPPIPCKAKAAFFLWHEFAILSIRLANMKWHNIEQAMY